MCTVRCAAGHIKNHEYLILDNLTSPLNRSYYSLHLTNKESSQGWGHPPTVTILEAGLRDPAPGTSCCPASPAVSNQHSTSWPALVSLGFRGCLAQLCRPVLVLVWQCVTCGKCVLIFTLSPTCRNVGTFTILEMEISLGWFSSSTGAGMGPVVISEMMISWLW